MMPIYITTDTHFNHMKLHEVFGDRPANFQDLIIASHNALPEDTLLIHLGDFCIGKDDEMHDKWNNATKHIQHRVLVRGNHDNKSDSYYLRHGWDYVCSLTIMRVFGKRVLFSHIPRDHTHYPTTEINIHGHTHGNTHRDFEIQDFYDPTYHREMALEHTDFKPVLLTPKWLEQEKPPIGSKQ